MNRALAAILAIGVAALAVGLGPAFGRTDAPLATTTCNVTGTVTFSPPITNVTQTTVSNVYNQVKLNTCSGTVSSATIKGALSGPASCKKGSARGTLTFKWNTGTKSKVKLRYKNGSLTGTVKSGTFAGGTVSGGVALSPTGNCASGVTSAAVSGTIKL